MELKHIEHTSCPECGSRIVSEEQDRQHTNGQWFERRKFECGMTIRHVPNFDRNEIYSPCPKDPSIMREKKKRDKAKEGLLDFIRGMKIPEEVREALIDNCDSSYIWNKGLN